MRSMTGGSLAFSLMAAVAVCGVLLAGAASAAAANATLYGVATDIQLGSTNQVLVTVDPATGRALTTMKISPFIGLIAPSCFVAVPPLSAVAVCTVKLTGEECISLLSSKDASVIKSFCAKDLVIDDLAFDTTTNQLLFNAFNQKAMKNYIYNLDYRGNGTMTELFSLPGIVQGSINAYSSANHTFFLTVEDQSGGNRLLAADVSTRRLLSNIHLDVALEILVVDPSTNRFLAWCATSSVAGELVEMDPHTGAFNVLVSFDVYSSNGGSSAAAPDGSGVYANLVTFGQSSNPFWVAVNGSKHTITPLKGAFPWYLGLAFL